MKLEASIGHFYAMHQENKKDQYDENLDQLLLLTNNMCICKGLWLFVEFVTSSNWWLVHSFNGKGRRGRSNFIHIYKELSLHVHCGFLDSSFVGSSDIIDKWIREAKESTVSFWNDHVEQLRYCSCLGILPVIEQPKESINDNMTTEIV